MVLNVSTALERRRIATIGSGAVVLSCLGACEPPVDDVSLTRVAPDETLVELDSVAVFGVRGCIHGVDEETEASSLPFAIEIEASISSESSGTATLSFGLDEDRQPYDVSLPPVHLTVGGDFEGLDLELVGPSQVDACSDWKLVEFSWQEVDGTDPMSAQWQVSFEPEARDDYVLGIDIEPM